MPLTLSIFPPRTRKRILLERAFYTAVAVVASVIVTAILSYALTGAIRGDFLATGFLCSLIVSVPMIANFQRMRRELAMALERERSLQVRQEKLLTLRQTMRKVHHHVNNLANNLQLVEIEQRKSGTLSAETLVALQFEITRTAKEMHMLGQLEDPFAKDAFSLDRDLDAPFSHSTDQQDLKTSSTS
jgi:hypothetical protein